MTDKHSNKQNISKHFKSISIIKGSFVLYSLDEPKKAYLIQNSFQALPGTCKHWYSFVGVMTALLSIHVSYIFFPVDFSPVVSRFFSGIRHFLQPLFVDLKDPKALFPFNNNNNNNSNNNNNNNKLSKSEYKVYESSPHTSNYNHAAMIFQIPWCKQQTLTKGAWGQEPP